MHTKTAIVLLLFLNVAAFTQNPPANSPLFDQLAGKWTAQTSIGGQSGTHDIDAEWVIQHHYLRLHEVSREKNAKAILSMKLWSSSRYDHRRTRSHVSGWTFFVAQAPRRLALLIPKRTTFL